jgi:hypothetical protein
MTPVEMLGPHGVPAIGELPYFLTLPGTASTGSGCSRHPQLGWRAPLPRRRRPSARCRRCWSARRGTRCSTATSGRSSSGTSCCRSSSASAGSAARRARSAPRGSRLGPAAPRPPAAPPHAHRRRVRGRPRSQYFLPLTICAYARCQSLAERAPHAVLANITGARKGILFDAWLDDRFARTLLETLEREDPVAMRRGTARAVQGQRFADSAAAARSFGSHACRPSRATRRSCTATG